MDSPDGRSVHPPKMGEVIEFPAADGCITPICATLHEFAWEDTANFLES